MELTIGRRILEERKRRGWEQADLAQRLAKPVGQQTVSRWEGGGSRPRRAVVVELAALFEVEPIELLAAAGFTELADQPQVRRPVRPRPTVLPIWELAPEKFEELTADIAQEQRPDTFVSRFGSQGHTQYGVDVVAEKDSRYVQTYQCKRRQEFGPQDVKDAVAQVTIIADAHCLVLSRRSASPEARREMQSHPGWTLWDAEDISRIVRGFPLDRSVRIVDTYFPGWREPFLGVAEPGPWLKPDEFFQPLSTGPIYNHDWTLVGRDHELDELLSFVNDPDKRIGLIVGRGGIGKSKLLREIARTVASQTFSVRFVKPGADVRPEHYELLPADGSVLLIIDDAHDRDDLTVVVGDVLRRSDRPKVLLALRPHGVDMLASDLRPLGIRINDLSRVSLSDLTHADAETLALEALGPEWPRRLAERLGYLTADCPFITVVAGVLIRRGLLDPACVDHEDTIRQEVLRTFRDVVVADPISGDPELRRSILDAIALLQPFRSADPAFQTSLGNLIHNPYDRAIRHMRSLENAGVLLRRGGSLRIVPDLLGDVVLSEACYDDAFGGSTGYIERGWAVAEGEAVRHLFVNATRVDWQLRHDHPGAPRLTDSLWDSVDSAAQSAGVLGRIALLKLLQKVAYFEPRRSLALAHWMVDHPTDVVENIDDPMLRLHEFTYEDVLHEVPAVLRAIAYDVPHLRESANLLWRLAANDRRETNRYPEHPLRILRSLAEFDSGKPLLYNHAMIDIAEEWLDIDPQPRGASSPFDVLEPLLATEGSEDSTVGFAIRFRPYLIDPAAVKPLRERVLDLAFKELGSADIGRAARAVKVIEASLHFPVGLFGRRIADNERDAWVPDFLRILSALADAVSCRPIEPVIAVAIRRALQWHLDYSEIGTRDAARAVLESLPHSLGTRMAVALFDGWGELLEHRTTNVRLMDDLKGAQMRTLASELIDRYNDVEIVDLLENEIAAQEVAFSGRAGNPGLFVASLVESRPSIGVAICNKAAKNPDSRVETVLAVAIARLAEDRPEVLMDDVRSLLVTGDIRIKRSVAHGLGWYRGRRSTLLEGEFDVLVGLIGEEDVVLRRLTVAAAQRLASDHPAEALALLSRVRFADSPEVAEEVFQSFTGRAPLRWNQLPKPHADAMLQQLVECPSIDDYWIQEFLSELSKDDPAGVVTLLMNRIDRWDEVESVLEYRPLPYQWHHPLRVSSSHELVAILRAVRDWLSEEPDSWKRHHEGGSLFAAIAQNFDDPDVRAVLEDTLATSNADDIAALATIIRHMPRGVFLSDVSFVRRVLHAGSNFGTDYVDRVMGAMHGAVISGSYTGTPGQPSARDLEQRAKARTLADSLTPGSAEERFYRALQRSAEDHIQWQSEQDERLLDGRDW